MRDRWFNHVVVESSRCRRHSKCIENTMQVMRSQDMLQRMGRRHNIRMQEVYGSVVAVRAEMFVLVRHGNSMDRLQRTRKLKISENIVSALVCFVFRPLALLHYVSTTLEIVPLFDPRAR